MLTKTKCTNLFLKMQAQTDPPQPVSIYLKLGPIIKSNLRRVQFQIEMDTKESNSPLHGPIEVRRVVGLLGAEVIHPEFPRVLVLQEGSHLLDGVPVPGPFPGGRKAVEKEIRSYS